MTIFAGIIVYLMVFWTLLFAVLPWGNKTPDELETGMAGSAPAKPRIKQKFLICAGLSAVIWLIIFVLVHYGVIDFYEISREMALEDKAIHNIQGAE